MKKFLFGLSLVLAIRVVAQVGPASVGNRTTMNVTVPEAVITDDSTYWAITTLSTMGYVNTTPGPYYNSYRSGGGMIVNFKFTRNNRFQFRLYVQANSYGTASEAWTEVEGSVQFATDAKGQNVFITKADKGTYRTNKNGQATSRPIPQSELHGQHSGIYLWERTNFPEDPANTYLLMVDLKQHPAADINKPGTIDPSWVSKFHIPVRN